MGILPNIFGRGDDDDKDIFDENDNIKDEEKFREKYSRDNIQAAVDRGHEHIRNQASGMEDNLKSNGSYSEFLAGKCSYEDMSDNDKAYHDRFNYEA